VSDVFLSYSHDDAATARRFAEALQAEGFSVWWDTALRSGEVFDAAIEAALRAAKAVVVLWSARSVASRWVRAEAALADRNGALVPAMIEACERPIMFELTHTADLVHWRGDPQDPEWRDLLADVRRLVTGEEPSGAASVAPPRAPRSARRGRPAIAVLPFANRSGLAEDDVFAAVLAEDVIAALSANEDIKVIAGSATAGYRGKAVDVRAIGRELKVRYVLEGAVRRSGPDMRVTAQLVEAETSNVLWSQKFDRPLADLGALEEDLVTEVAGHLGVQVQRVEMARAARNESAPTGWEAMMRALATVARITPETAQLAIDEARRAVERAPASGAAHAVLAVAQSIAFLRNGDPALAKAIRAEVEEAVELAGETASAQALSAVALSNIGAAQDALPYAERAAEMKPTVTLTRHALGVTLFNLGRLDQAIAEFEAAERLAPEGMAVFFGLTYQACAHLQAGRLDRADALLDRALRLNPQFDTALIAKILCAIRLGEDDAARRALARLRRNAPAVSLDGHLWRIRHFIPDTALARDLATSFEQLWSAMPEEPPAPG
jgi:TolB-like protein/Tfp pilus assembly protein PilF